MKRCYGILYGLHAVLVYALIVNLWRLKHRRERDDIYMTPSEFFVKICGEIVPDKINDTMVVPVVSVRNNIIYIHLLPIKEEPGTSPECGVAISVPEASFPDNIAGEPPMTKSYCEKIVSDLVIELIKRIKKED